MRKQAAGQTGLQSADPSFTAYKMFSLIIYPTNNIHYMPSVTLSKKIFDKYEPCARCLARPWDTENGQGGPLHQGYSTTYRQAWPPGAVSLEQHILHAVGEMDMTQVRAGSTRRKWQPLSDTANVPLASCVTLSKTFSLFAPLIPNCKIQAVIMVPTLQVPQEGCEHSAD